jgi:hypothetical protein
MLSTWQDFSSAISPDLRTNESDVLSAFDNNFPILASFVVEGKKFPVSASIRVLGLATENISRPSTCILDK